MIGLLFVPHKEGRKMAWLDCQDKETIHNVLATASNCTIPSKIDDIPFGASNEDYTAWILRDANTNETIQYFIDGICTYRLCQIPLIIVRRDNTDMTEKDIDCLLRGESK